MEIDRGDQRGGAGGGDQVEALVGAVGQAVGRAVLRAEDLHRGGRLPGKRGGIGVGAVRDGAPEGDEDQLPRHGRAAGADHAVRDLLVMQTLAHVAAAEVGLGPHGAGQGESRGQGQRGGEDRGRLHAGTPSVGSGDGQVMVGVIRCRRRDCRDTGAGCRARRDRAPLPAARASR